MTQPRTVAYFSMEIGLEPGMPARAAVTIEGRTVHIRAWERLVVGCGGTTVPVYFLDTDLPENSKWDRTLTHFLYGGDSHYRLCQEVVLGIGGGRMLAALGYDQIERFHMNEGHASFLALELLEEQARLAGRTTPNHDDVEAVRRRCVFTTHTPIPAGHDQFPLEMVTRVLGDRDAFRMPDVFCCEGSVNMTYLGITGWAIGDYGRDGNIHADRSRDAAALYDKLESAVILAFYRERDRFIDVMRHAIALNGSFFNTQRMMQEYVLKAYFS